MKRVDLVSAIVFMLVGVLAINEAVHLPRFESYGPGGDFAPFWLGVILIFLAVLLVLRAVTLPERGGGEPLIPPPDGRVRVAYILAAIVVYTALLEYLGYLLSTFLFLAFLVAVLAHISRRAVLAIAAGGTLAFTGLFSWLLGIPLPQGFLPI